MAGPLPMQLGHLLQLQELSLFGNKCTGAFGILSLRHDPSSLSANVLRTFPGPLPTQLGHLSLLQKLFLDNNKLNGARTFPVRS